MASTECDGDATAKRKKILFLTSSEYGQANVILAVAYELLLLQQHSVHVASFAPLKDRVQDLNGSIPDNHVPAVFHTVFGPSALETILAKDQFIGPYPVGVKGALDTYRSTLPAIATAWDGPTYLKGHESCLEIIRSVEPDVIVVDPLFSHGLDACKTLSRRFVVLSPNTFQETCRRQQPVFATLCRYPSLSSGFAFPVPWYLVPANIYLKIMMIWYLIRNPILKAFMEYRTSHGLPGLGEAYDLWNEKNLYLLPSIPETDYPCVIPSNVIGCGPILLPTPPVWEGDVYLHSWLKRPTVLINLGTHIQMDDTMAREFVAALKTVLDSRPDLQILWKLKRSRGLAIRTKSGSAFQEVKDGFLDPISHEISSRRVWIEEWLSASPLEILQFGNVVCAVHHGGSNSFHEALSAGVPQVVLPCWLDTFEFARRVEWLGIGVYGSPTAAPSVESQELSQALMTVLGDGKKATQIKRRAKELADISGRVGGRKKALEKIIEVLENS